MGCCNFQILAVVSRPLEYLNTTVVCNCQFKSESLFPVAAPISFFYAPSGLRVGHWATL